MAIDLNMDMSVRGVIKMCEPYFKPFKITIRPATKTYFIQEAKNEDDAVEQALEQYIKEQVIYEADVEVEEGIE